MKLQRVLIVLTVVNLALLVFLLTQVGGTVAAQGSLPVLRGSALEIIDGQGRVRASITINPPVVVDSQAYPESVLLRMSDKQGGPGVKLDTSSRGAGLRLSDGSEIGAIALSAKVAGSSVKVTSSDGREQLLKP